jgi:dienelactone hydrolase
MIVQSALCGKTQAVANPAYGVDQRWPENIKFPPKVEHVGLHDASVTVEVVVPDVVENLCLGQDALGVDHQVVQQVVLRWSEFNTSCATTHFAGVFLQHQVSKAQHCAISTVWSTAAGPAQNRSHPSDELIDIKWFRDVVICTKGQPANLVGRSVLGGQKDDWGTVSFKGQTLLDSEPVTVWKHHVKQDEIGSLRSRGPHAVVARGRSNDVKAFVLQNCRDEFRDGGFVFNNKDRGTHGYRFSQLAQSLLRIASGACAPGTLRYVSTPGPETLIRSLYWAAKVTGGSAPFDTAHLKVFYQARPTWSHIENMTGSLPADSDIGVAPVVVVVPGINVNPDSYRWLATELAAAGYVVVVMAYIAQIGPAVGLSSGIDLRFARRETWGQQATAPALNDVVESLSILNATPNQPLFGHLDTTRVALFGHSAGGAGVLQNTSTTFFPWLRAAVTYGAHSLGSVTMGWPEGSVTPIVGDCPIMLIGGTADGVIAASAGRYGEDATTREDPFRRSFAAIDGPMASNARLVLIEGANHFAVAHPIDETCARSFLESDSQVDMALTRQLISALMIAFLDSHIRNRSKATTALQHLDERFGLATVTAQAVPVPEALALLMAAT